MEIPFWMNSDLHSGFPFTNRVQRRPVRGPDMFSSEVPVAVRGQSKAVPAQRVVKIPVQFMESGRKRSDSAVKIQKAFRGFVVRKNLKKISAIRREVNEIEHKIAEKETFDLIRTNSKERLKVIEALMSLLFRLDSVRGVDAGVRDFRKAVIKKAIALQELIDAIVAGNHTPESGHIANSENQTEEIGETAMDQTLENQGNSNSTERVSDSANNCYYWFMNQEKKASNPESAPVLSKSEATPDELIADNGENQEIVEENEEIIEDPHCQEESNGTTQTESQTDSSMNPEALVEHDEVTKEEDVIVEDNVCGIGSGEREQNNRDLLERMIEDNEKMMGMMAQLFEKNDKQTRLLNTLSQRVEQLEKAFICEKLRRKKKRNAGGPASDVLERSPDSKRCGKR